MEVEETSQLFCFIHANRHSPPCCRLDTSLLSAAHQGAERRSACKVTKLITLGNVHSPLP